MAFWAYENWRAHGHRARIHRAECGACNDGAGVQGGSTTPKGRWHGPFITVESAIEAATRTGAEVVFCMRCAPG
jgi:hypothetical protein